jgi:hypothetical protein
MIFGSQYFVKTSSSSNYIDGHDSGRPNAWMEQHAVRILNPENIEY